MTLAILFSFVFYAPI